MFCFCTEYIQCVLIILQSQNTLHFVLANLALFKKARLVSCTNLALLPILLRESSKIGKRVRLVSTYWMCCRRAHFIRARVVYLNIWNAQFNFWIVYPHVWGVMVWRYDAPHHGLQFPRFQIHNVFTTPLNLTQRSTTLGLKLCTHLNHPILASHTFEFWT